MTQMLKAFIEYERNRTPALLGIQHNLIGVAIGTRLMRIIRRPNSWILWIATNDYKHGTYLELWNDGHAEQVTSRRDEGDEIFIIRPSDGEIS